MTFLNDGLSAISTAFSAALELATDPQTLPYTVGALAIVVVALVKLKSAPKMTARR